MSKNYNKIVVLNFITTTIGDSLYLFPVIQKLKKEFPKSDLFLTGSRITKTLVGKDSSLKNYILIPNLEKVPSASKFNKIKIFSQVLFFTYKQLKKIKPDLCLVYLPNFSVYQLIPFISGVPNRIGFTYPGSIFSFVLNKKRPFRNPETTGEIVHLSQANLDLLELLNIKINKEDLILKKELEPNPRLDKLILKYSKPIIAFQPGAKHKNRQWPPERFIKLAKRLIKYTKGSIILIGSPSEKDICKKISSNVGKDCINLAGETKLEDIPYILSKCKLVIGNDSGIMHLAASVKCDTITLFGRSNPNHSNPMGVGKNLFVKSKIWNKDALFKKEDINKPSKYLLQISVNMVLKEVEKIMKLS